MAPAVVACQSVAERGQKASTLPREVHHPALATRHIPAHKEDHTRQADQDANYLTKGEALSIGKHEGQSRGPQRRAGVEYRRQPALDIKLAPRDEGVGHGAVDKPHHRQWTPVGKHRPHYAAPRHANQEHSESRKPKPHLYQCKRLYL